ncbi:hypothetical protein DITRI_Ditri17bG0060900 [Diplodiscus trichospermus]
MVQDLGCRFTELRSMEKDRSQIILKEKLEFLDILKQALEIPRQHIKFIIFTIFTSLPYFCLSVFFEVVLQQTLLDTFNFFKPTSYYPYYDWDLITFRVDQHRLMGNLSGQWIKLCLLYLLPCHLLWLLNIVMTVNAASMIYLAKKPTSLRDMTVQKTRPYDYFLCSSITIFHAAVFIALLVKYSEWSAGWSMALVISVLEETDRIEAFQLSAYFGKGSTQRGLALMFVFVAWEIVLRLPSVLGSCSGRVGGLLFISVCSGLIFIGNLMKWVVCVVYFFDCKKRILEKKADEEVGTDAIVINV